MATANNMTRKIVPLWVIITIACLGILVLGYFGKNALTGTEAEVGSPKKVYPGMYDIRAEAAKMREKEAGKSQNGP